MSNSRALRSTRSTGSSSTNSLGEKTPSPSHETRKKKPGRPPKKRRGAPHVTLSKRTSPSSSTQPSSASSGESEGDGAAEADENEEDDKMDVCAPPSDNVDESSLKPSPTSNDLESSSKSMSRAGLGNQTSNYDAMIDDVKINDSVVTGNGMKNKNIRDLQSSKLNADEDIQDNESDSECESATNFEVADDDDDYGGVDNVSIASDDSRDFEAEVEREIQAEGEDGIDWDDEATYRYDATLGFDTYGFGHESGMAHSMLLDFEIFAPENHHDSRMTQSAPALAELERMLDAGESSVEAILALDHSTVSTSETQSVTAAPTSSAVTKSGTSSRNAKNVDANDGDTTDEDITWTTVSSPGVTLSRSNSNVARKLSKSAKSKRKVRKKTMMRKILPDPDKAIAYSVSSHFGSTVRFCTPSNKKYRWMDLCGSRNSSRASSPTLINLEDAYMHGNTRTGAHITDVINGTLFSRLHCRNASETQPASATVVSNFYKPLLEDTTGTSQDLKNAEKPIDESALALIDFSGGIEERSSDNGLSAKLDNDTAMANAMPSSPPLGPSTQLQTPMTPTSDVDMIMTDQTISPRKRRLSNPSNDRKEFSAETKKQRLSISGEVAV